MYKKKTKSENKKALEIKDRLAEMKAESLEDSDEKLF